MVAWDHAPFAFQTLGMKGAPSAEHMQIVVSILFSIIPI